MLCNIDYVSFMKFGSEALLCLIWIIFGVLHDGHQGQPGLLSSGDDLIGWQEETIAASVSQLKRVGVLDALFIGPVNSDSISFVWEQRDSNEIIINNSQSDTHCNIDKISASGLL